MEAVVRIDRILLGSILVSVIMSFACVRTRSRLDAIEALERFRQYRGAQLYFNATEGRYGKPEELKSHGLIDTNFIGDPAYRYRTTTTDTEYTISAEPRRSDNFSIFMDQTGVIRVSEGSPATAASEPIKIQ